MGALKSTETIRPFRNEDMDQVADLYEQVNGCPPNTTSQVLRQHLQRVFVDNIWRDERFPSLVTEEKNGRISGCLGVIPRPMKLAGREIIAATSHSFAVAPQSRSSMAAMSIVRHFLAGPQDLSLCQGDEISVRIWELFGGTLSQIYSLGWLKPLRPASYALTLLKRRGLPGLIAAPLQLLCSGADSLAPKLAASAFHFPKPDLDSRDFDIDIALQRLPAMTTDKKLMPCYSRDSLEWLLTTLQSNPNRGRLRQQMLLRGGRVMGWYIYYLRDGVVAEVAQIASEPQELSSLFEHLFWQARQDGALSAIGQVEPAQLNTLYEHSCVLRKPGKNGLLLHAKDREIVNAINDGHAFLSRLEGEWWISELLR